MIDISQWRAAIGSWNCCRVCSTLNPTIKNQRVSSEEPNDDLKCNKRLISSLTSNDHSRSSQSFPDDVDTFVWFSSVVSRVTPDSFCFGLYFMLHLILLLLLLSGDVELNPGPATVKEVFKLVEESLRQNFDTLKEATTYSIDGIRAGLFSEGLISESVKDSPTYDKIINEFKIGLRLMQDVSKIQKRYDTFLDCFSSQGGPAKDASDQLRKEWTQIKQQIEKFNQKEDKQHDSLSDPHVKELSVALQVYTSDLNKSGIDTQATLNYIKSRIESHFKMMLEDGLSKDAINKQLNELTMNALIPSDINDWCYYKLDELCKKEDKIVADEFDTSSSDDLFEERPPLFSPDAVYHASLCNLFVNSEDASQMLTEYGHTFDELSVSLSGNTRMLIAQKQNIVYICFSFLDYAEDIADEIIALTNSILFIEFVSDKILKNIPLRYFVELLYQNKRIILTGFSAGAVFAWSILLKLWNLPYFSSRFLQQNLHCIMFGFPPKRAPYKLSNAQLCTSDTLQSCHSFLLEGHLFNLLKKEEFNQLYKEVIYLIYQKVNEDLSWIKSPETLNLSKDAAIGEKGEKNNAELLKVYHLYIFRGYLDKEDYSVPPRKVSPTDAVKSLIPSITGVELHCYKDPNGSEIAIAINGDNLWFCDGIDMVLYGENHEEVPIKVEISAQTVTQKRICYNQSLNKENFLPCHCSLEVHSKFAKSFKGDFSIIYHEPDPISFRQSQLAKQTPSQIIQLSFLSALLEQSHSSRPTKRFRQITKFLQEVSSIVPVESAFFAVANTKKPGHASKIVQAIVSAAQFSIPLSEMMAIGCAKALKHLIIEKHVYPEFISSMKFDIENLHFPHHHFRLTKDEIKHEIVQSVSTQQTTSLKFVNLQKLYKEPRKCLQVICECICDAAHNKSTPINLVSGRNIGDMYPISKAITFTQQSTTSYGKINASERNYDASTPLPHILQNARKCLADLSASHKEAKLGVAAKNSNMLEEVNKIIEGDLKPCVEMLGGFMEQQIKVPLVKNPRNTAKALRTMNFGAIGVWALFSLSEDDIKHILQSKKNKALVIQIAEFIEGTVSKDVASKQHDTELTTSYDAKLQFLLQGLKLQQTITCSSSYISYSLERELVSICKECNITTTTKVEYIINNWPKCFDKTALALVPVSHQQLLARWLVWALNIYQLREGLANYTTVGVIGLVNCGKSTLVNKVFKIETIQGTTQSARTTVPFIYNLDSAVEGLSVIDFPGVDDRDESIGDLAELLMGLAQIVIFVCAYNRFHTSSAKKWMEIFDKDFTDTPILVCLTHADDLYQDSCDDDMIPECPEDKISTFEMQLDNELKKIIGDTKTTQKCSVKFCSLAQRKRSPLDNDKSRASMKKVGIIGPEDVEEWIEKALRRDIQQPELADKFKALKNKI